jgi:hypothetical protein
MRDRKAVEVKADVEARIAQIEQMTLEQIGVFSAESREASALHRALRKRLKAIEQQLREGG